MMSLKELLIINVLIWNAERPCFTMLKATFFLLIDSYNRNHQNFMCFFFACHKVGMKTSFKKKKNKNKNYFESAYLQVVLGIPIERQYNPDKKKQEKKTISFSLCLSPKISSNYNWPYELVMLTMESFYLISHFVTFRAVQFI